MISINHRLRVVKKPCEAKILQWLTKYSLSRIICNQWLLSSSNTDRTTYVALYTSYFRCFLKCNEIRIDCIYSNPKVKSSIFIRRQTSLSVLRKHETQFVFRISVNSWLNSFISFLKGNYQTALYQFISYQKNSCINKSNDCNYLMFEIRYSEVRKISCCLYSIYWDFIFYSFSLS